MSVVALDFEEVRAIVIDILIDEQSDLYINSRPQFQKLLTETLKRIDQKNSSSWDGTFVSSPMRSLYSELIRDVFWDLFRQGFITLGADSNNETWPWFRLSHFGKHALQAEEPLRFHNVDSFLELVKASAPDLSEITEKYLA